MADTTQPQMVAGGQSRSIFTKKRFNELLTLFHTLSPQADANAFAKGMREIMNFDPEKKHYTPELGKKIAESRRRVAERKGVSINEVSGSKACYERKKLLQQQLKST